MSLSWERKRKFRRNDNKNRNDSFKRPRYDEKFEIINKVESQKGVRGQLVIFESSLDTPYTVLQNAVDRINGIMAVNNVDKNEGCSKFRLTVNNETFAEESYESASEAKKGLAELALSNLRKSCFTIFRMGTLIKSAVNTAYSVEVQKENFCKERLEQLKALTTLLETKWAHEISSEAGQNLAINKFNKPTLIPMAEDIMKIHPRDSPKIELTSPSCSKRCSTNTSSTNSGSTSNHPPQTNLPNIGGIGAKMMLQMGWSGGGLGAQEQGRTTIVQPYLQIQRQGLGTKNIVLEVTKVLQNYASSRDINSIAFSPDFTKEERVVIHEVARKLNLKSRSYGKDTDRILVVQSKVKPWDLIYSLLATGGESEQLKLILPTDFDK